MTDVFSSAQPRVALPATEMLLVVLVLVCRNELLSEYQLVARVTARTQQLCVVTSAVQSTIVL